MQGLKTFTNEHVCDIVATLSSCGHHGDKLRRDSCYFPANVKHSLTGSIRRKARDSCAFSADVKHSLTETLRRLVHEGRQSTTQSRKILQRLIATSEKGEGVNQLTTIFPRSEEHPFPRAMSPRVKIIVSFSSNVSLITQQTLSYHSLI